MQKVTELNLERGFPTIEASIRTMQDALTSCRRQGIRALILIHGYGSTGVGGGIRAAVRKKLAEPGMGGVVRDFTGGEQWHYRKKEYISMCKELGNYEGRITNNEGVTVVILR
jgi:hypothetical protein